MKLYYGRKQNILKCHTIFSVTMQGCHSIVRNRTSWDILVDKDGRKSGVSHDRAFLATSAKDDVIYLPYIFKIMCQIQ